MVDGHKYPLSFVPSGRVTKEETSYRPGGRHQSPGVLFAEIAMLESAGYRVDLMIDPRCHIVMPYHTAMDSASEVWKGKDATGASVWASGIAMKTGITSAGIRLEFLMRPALLKEKLEKILPLKRAIIEKDMA